jgi:hypothetical protein
VSSIGKYDYWNRLRAAINLNDLICGREICLDIDMGDLNIELFEKSL